MIQFRYSLLTLLVLTALVAGGVKIWYGPHSALLGDPPSVEEQEMLLTFPNQFSPHKFNMYGEFRYEYRYLQHWDKRDYLQIRMLPAKALPIHQEGVVARFALLPAQVSEELTKLPTATGTDVEYLHHVCYLPQCPEQRANNGQFADLLPPDRGYYRLYFISTKGHVYGMTLSNIFLSLVREDLNTLSANVRAGLQQEIEFVLE